MNLWKLSAVEEDFLMSAMSHKLNGLCHDEGRGASSLDFLNHILSIRKCQGEVCVFSDDKEIQQGVTMKALWQAASSYVSYKTNCHSLSFVVIQTCFVNQQKILKILNKLDFLSPLVKKFNNCQQIQVSCVCDLFFLFLFELLYAIMTWINLQSLREINIFGVKKIFFFERATCRAKTLYLLALT